MKGSRIDKIDKSLEIATLVRSSESGYARDYRTGNAFGSEGDRRRLDAFTLGLLDGLSQRFGKRDEILMLLTYLHKLQEHGPGTNVRDSYREMLALADVTRFSRYVAGGRYHAIRMISGNDGEVGWFARLLADELTDN